jgi:phosphopantetheinyl transferase (holo-ACP synthase)
VARTRLDFPVQSRVIDGFEIAKAKADLFIPQSLPALRPFPFPSLSIGTDIAHIPRIARLVASKETFPRFLRKVLTSREERDFHLRFPQDVSNVSDGVKSKDGVNEGEQKQRSTWENNAASRPKSVQGFRDMYTARKKRDASLRLPQDPPRDPPKSGVGVGVGESGYRWVDTAARFLAGRWAAKEAVVKACSWRSLTFDEIQILKDEGSNRIYGVILDRPEVRDIRADWQQRRDTLKAPPVEEQEDGNVSGQIVKVSISHDGEYATAVCLAAEESNTCMNGTHAL